MHTIKLKLLLLSLLALCFTSCTDVKLAKDLNGTWKASANTVEDGNKMKQTFYERFKQSGSDAKGSLTEVLVTEVNNVDMGEAKMDAGYQSYIKGTWEIKDGDLYTSYDLSTLKVKVGKDNLKVHDNGSLVAIDDYCDEHGLAILDGSSVDETIDMLQKEYIKGLQKTYKKENEETDKAYRDVKIDGDEMSYITSNGSRLKFKKVKVNLKKIYKGNGDGDDSGDDDADNESASTDVKPSNGISDKDKEDIENLVSAWDALHNNVSQEGVAAVYAPTTSFYGQNLSRSEIESKLEDLLVKAPDFSQDSHDLTFEVQDNGDVMVEFTKGTMANGKSHDYPAYLVLKRASNDYGWSILKESDKITDRNLQK